MLELRKIKDPVTNELLAIVAQPTNEPGPPVSRINISPETELLQAAVIRNCSNKPKQYDAHVHYNMPRQTYGTAEAWVVVKGLVVVEIFTKAGKSLQTFQISAGTVFLSFRGGHGFRVQPGACIVEIKNGPYYGRAADKELLGET